MTRETKTVNAFITSIEQKEDAPLGIVDHLISVYGIVDSGQDMAHKGMFTKTIKERKDDIVVADNHNHGSVMDVLGMPLEFYEVGRHELPSEVLKKFPDATGGQCAKTQFLLDTPEGLGAFTRLKAGAIKKFSFAYEVIQKEYEQVGDIKVRHLREVKLYEYGPVVFPMNDAAAMIAAKSENEEPAAWTELKEIGFGRQASKLRDAFYSDYTRFEELSDSGEATYKWYNIVDVFEKYLIVDTSDSPLYFKVGYSQKEDGAYTFEVKGDWVEGMLEFIPKVADAAAKSTDEDEALLEAADIAIKSRLEEMRQELGIKTEAGPEDTPQSTSETESNWEVENQKISEELKTWRI